jgi:HEAT repeat protein
MREVLPVLISSLTNPDSDVAARQGVCLGLAEVISCGSQRQLEAHLEVVRFAVRQAMCDENEEVRAAASGAFSALVKSFGQHAVKEMVPSLLDALEASSDEDATLTPEHATHGLRAVIELRGRVVMPMIVARLVEPPITAARASAMKTVAKAASTIIHLYLPKLLPPLLQTIADGVADPAVIEASRDAATAIVMSIRGDAGLRALVSRLGELVDNSEGANLRAEGAWLMGKLCEGAAADLEEFVPTILSHLVMLYSSQDEAILAAALSALTALTAARSDEELSEHIPAIRSVVAGMRSDMKHKMHLGDEELLLPGLCQKNGLKPMLPMFQHALLKGTPVMREHAAAGIGELIGLTSPAALKPFIIKLTGPLIRIMHDRFPRGVKIAILDTLITLIHMGGARLRPFLPQLQTTFVKALGDPESAVRSQSIKALTALLDLKPRVGPLIGELRAGAVSAPTENIQAAMLEALSRVLRSPMKMTASTLTLITGCFDAVMDASMLGNESDAVRRAAADVIAAAIALMPGDQASDLLRSTIFPIAKDGFASPWPLRHGMAVTLGAVLASSNDSAELEGVVSGCADEVMAILVDSTADDRAQVQVCPGFLYEVG